MFFERDRTKREQRQNEFILTVTGYSTFKVNFNFKPVPLKKPDVTSGYLVRKSAKFASEKKILKKTGISLRCRACI